MDKRVRCTDCRHGRPEARCPRNPKRPFYNSAWRKCAAFARFRTCGHCLHADPLVHSPSSPDRWCTVYEQLVIGDLRTAERDCPRFQAAVDLEELAGQLHEANLAHAVAEVADLDGRPAVRFTRQATSDERRQVARLIGGER